MMEFIKDLQESRMTRQGSTVKQLTYSDCCENMYLILLTLDIMSKFPSQTSFTRMYARKSRSLKYDKFKIDSTDLHNLIYFITGDEEALGKLRDPGAARRTQGRVAFPLRDVQQYLANMASGQGSFAPQQMFIRIENGLSINNRDYKEIRRYLVKFTNEPEGVKKNILTRLLFALRARLRNSDIIDNFSKLVADNDLESSTVKDTEDYPSTPDIASAPQDILWYKLIDKGISIVPLKNFLEHVKSNKLPTRPMVQAYMPMIEMIDDIVAAGPSHIHQLKILHNRAKKNKD